ncbi:helix-turn-helix domain-containing protein [Halobacillus litoralis]|uniref:helix-turn-helix domain-containing protein n=1 Tax=Halobacillus litoralis TaxID=45668 RepID=UPI001CD20D84|nr:helix-turn-helix transcriptional regulator [Halobacillus litoralis]MCA0970930.1 helix-turn-helix domain-containing protein [Halobacillus litoralis]
MNTNRENEEARIKQAFGQRVRQLRLELEMSQEEMAIQAGFDRTYISSVERGERNPALTTICRIANGLNILPNDLISEIRYMDEKK